jgi:ribosomal protein S20
MHTNKYLKNKAKKTEVRTSIPNFERHLNADHHDICNTKSVRSSNQFCKITHFYT